MHTIQSDCGKFVRSEFTDVLQKHSILFETTPPYTPEYNGVMEQSGHTAMEMVQVILKASQMPQPLWAEALARPVCYLGLACEASHHHMWVTNMCDQVAQCGIPH